MNVAIFISDKRMKYLAEYLKKDHHFVTTIMNQNQFDMISKKNFDWIVLPMQGMNAKGEILCGKEKINIFDFLECQNENCVIYSGVNHELLSRCQAQSICILEDTQINEKNAILTAEGVLDSILRNSEMGIRETKVDVIGYGICGKALVKMLVDLDCPVRIVSTRKLNGIFLNNKYIETLYYPEYRINTDFLVNTAPSLMITCEMIKSALSKPFIIDIASNAVGVEKKLQNCSLVQYEYLPGIPGKFSPKSAALILYEAIKERGLV